MLTPTDERMLKGVHPDLVKIVREADWMSPGMFKVLEGVRTLARQQELLAHGATTTLKSRHLTGHAVDLGALVAGKLRWDWPLYSKQAGVVKQAAVHVGVPVEWGGDWKSFKDGPHFQLPWDAYP